MLLYAPLTVYWFKWFWNLLCFVNAYVDVVDELHECVLWYHYLGHYIVMVFVDDFVFQPINFSFEQNFNLANKEIQSRKIQNN